VRRTTRQSHPTEAGLAFYRRVRPAFTEIRDARLEAASQQAELTGLLRVGAPALFAAAHIVPVISELVQRHPRIEIELKVSDREVDLVAERLDLAVRIREMRDSTLKARRLGEIRAVVFGAPSYFARHGRPRHPDELALHGCVVRLTDGDAETWPFRVAGRRRSIKQGRRALPPGQHRRDQRGRGMWRRHRLRAALAGARPRRSRRGRDHARGIRGGQVPIHAVWLPTKVPLAKAQMLTESLIARLKRERL
jgi:DNA-binding transcriptional LysR family regulator